MISVHNERRLLLSCASLTSLCCLDSRRACPRGLPKNRRRWTRSSKSSRRSCRLLVRACDGCARAGLSATGAHTHAVDVLPSGTAERKKYIYFTFNQFGESAVQLCQGEYRKKILDKLAELVPPPTDEQIKAKRADLSNVVEEEDKEASKRDESASGGIMCFGGGRKG
jgi:hypothetical protein